MSDEPSDIRIAPPAPKRRIGWETWVVCAILTAVVLVNLCPFLWVVLSSIKPSSEIYAKQVTFIPRDVTLDNYRQLFRHMIGFDRYYLNSLLVTVATVGLSLLVGSLAAFAFARFEFRGRDVLFYTLVFSMFIPGEVALIGRFELFSQLHLVNKLTGLVVAYTSGSLALVLFIMRNVFRGIPQDMIDAARIDGASLWQIFWEIMIPLSKTGLVAAGVLTFMGAWNEFLFALTITWSNSARTLPVGIMMLRDQYEHWEYGMLFATVMLSFLPVMILFIVLQKHFIRGVTAGAIKG